jgi:hypothetical protein
MSKILFVIEIGGFPLKFDALLAAGHEVEYTSSMRKAIPLLKKLQPDIMLAEFQYTSQFRDRDSNMDTIMTQIVSRSPHTKVIALVEEEQQIHYERLKSRFDNIRDQLYFPFEAADLDNKIFQLLDQQAT